MEFSNLVQSLPELVASTDMRIRIDSRLVEPGDIFVAIAGVNDDGAKYIPAAVQAGASVIVCEFENDVTLEAANKGVAIVLHPKPRKALWQLAEIYYDTTRLCQSNNAKIIGITGTNGKTTCAYLLEHLFTRLGHKVGVMGTVSYRWPGHEQEAPLTTPDSLTTHEILSIMLKSGVDVIIMEVSSHALDQERVGGINFAGAIFTNLTQDHLDFHDSMQNYFDAKSKLFINLPQLHKAIAINTDDEWGQKLNSICSSDVKNISFGLKQDNTNAQDFVSGKIISMSPSGLHLKMQCGHEQWELQSPLVGAFNAYNLLAVQALGLGLGLCVDNFQHLADFSGVCGRLEKVINELNLNVFVDYAHTPDALINVLQALRGAGFEKIITVFGCGGNRDRTKRPLMGKAVAEHTDIAMLTSDNPRFENPQDIINDVLPGLKARPGLEVMVEVDRKVATIKAIELLKSLDVTKSAVLIAGKGHEDYQIIEGVKYPFSDQKNVQEYIGCV